MSATTIAFVGALVNEVQALRPLLEEHLSDQEGEVLPHLLMADIERWVETEIMNHRNEAAVADVLGFLEQGLVDGDPDVGELIVVSFVEHLPQPGQIGSEVRDMLGPHLAQWG